MRAQLAMITTFSSFVLSAPAYPADSSPGMWEISLEMRVPAQPGFVPPPFQLKQCLTAADARDPSRVLAGIANPGATSCTYADKSYSGNTFRFSVQCAGGFAIQLRGEVSFGPDSMNGTMTGVANVDGAKTEMNNKISARRLGDC